MITISFEQLQAIPGVVSHGIVRLAATRAILRSGVVDYLVSTTNWHTASR